MKIQHKENPEIYQCVDCKKEFKWNDYLTVHRSLVHKAVNVAVDMVETLRQDDGSYKCKDCGEVFLGNEADKNVVAHLMKKCKSDDQFCAESTLQLTILVSCLFVTVVGLRPPLYFFVKKYKSVWNCLKCKKFDVG